MVYNDILNYNNAILKVYHRKSPLTPILLKL